MNPNTVRPATKKATPVANNDSVEPVLGNSSLDSVVVELVPGTLPSVVFSVVVVAEVFVGSSVVVGVGVGVGVGVSVVVVVAGASVVGVGVGVSVVVVVVVGASVGVVVVVGASVVVVVVDCSTFLYQ